MPKTKFIVQIDGLAIQTIEFDASSLSWGESLQATAAQTFVSPYGLTTKFWITR